MLSKFEKFVFLALVFSIPFQKRFFLFGPSPEGEGFFEWTSGFLYFTDILVIFLLALWARNITRNVSLSWMWPLTLFAGFAFISLTQAELVDVGVYRFVKLAEFIFLFFYAAARVRSIGIKPILGAFVASGVFQSILAILQFAKQSSLGLEIFHESTLSVGLKGVAEISVGPSFAGGYGGQGVLEFIRAYGTFPSPNVLAGFLGICLLFLFYLFLETQLLPWRRIRRCLRAHSRHASVWLSFESEPEGSSLRVEDRGSDCLLSLREIWRSQTKQSSNPLVSNAVSFLIIFMLSFGLILTFSRGVIVFFVFTTVLFFAGIFLLEKLKKYRKQAISLAVLVIVSWALIVVALWPEVSARVLESSVSEPAIQERLFFNEVGIDTVRQNYPQLFFGVGMGNFVHHYMQSLPGLAPYLYQPVHNIFILIASEVGILGFGAFVLFLTFLIGGAVRIFLKFLPKDIQKNYGSINFIYLYSLLCVACFVLLVGMYDHYFWTLQQGSLMFWISLGLLAGISNINKGK